jgi:DNA-binding MarR family transcriptional regulator
MTSALAKPGRRTVDQNDLVDQLLSEWRRERPDLDASSLAVVGRVLHLGRLLEISATENLRHTGVSYTEFDVLATLRRSGRPYRLSPTELRHSVLLTSGAMTACLDRLERRKLLVRTADPHDRRSLYAGLTKRGVELIDEIAPIRFADASKAVARLSVDERSKLATLLRRLANSL